MPTKKKYPERSSGRKLYHGTSEAIAKLACAKGLIPYDVSVFDGGVPRNILASAGDNICLTSVYSGLMAMETAGLKGKWGIVEIDLSMLVENNLLPYEGFLAEKKKRTKVNSESARILNLESIRKTLPANHKRWLESLDNCGFCVYSANIPASAITRVTIYDPRTNPAMTKAVIVPLGSSYHSCFSHRQELLTKWFLGDEVKSENWIESSYFSKMSSEEKDNLHNQLCNKHGLDLFYTGSSSSKKSPIPRW